VQLAPSVESINWYALRHVANVSMLVSAAQKISPINSQTASAHLISGHDGDFMFVSEFPNSTEPCLGKQSTLLKLVVVGGGSRESRGDRGGCAEHGALRTLPVPRCCVSATVVRGGGSSSSHAEIFLWGGALLFLPPPLVCRGVGLQAKQMRTDYAYYFKQKVFLTEAPVFRRGSSSSIEKGAPEGVAV